MANIDAYRGCLVGGAVGDALGYAVEFWSESRIFSRYGKGDITGYDLGTYGEAHFSDDTQMTLFTANGLLLGAEEGASCDDLGPYVSCVASCYGDWYRTQTEKYPLDNGCWGDRCRSWLVGLPRLFARRAPGNTCLSACAAGCPGTTERPVNNSKGCGGVMRVAPVGLYLDAASGTHCNDYADVQRLGAECAALTHGHELGWLSAGAFAQIVSMLAHEPGCGVREATTAAMHLLPEVYPEARYVAGLQAIVERALTLADSSGCDLDCIHELGEGWVAEEALAIAVFCALRHEGDFEAAIVAAVNHNGDSDSTGAVCGNILGAKLGLAGIPAKYTERLELVDYITAMADDLYNDCLVPRPDRSAFRQWSTQDVFHLTSAL